MTSSGTSAFAEARRQFHAGLLAGGVLGVNDKGVPSNADSSNRTSISYARAIADTLKVETVSERLAGLSMSRISGPGMTVEVGPTQSGPIL